MPLRLPFRRRLLLILLAVALVPSIAITMAWSVGVGTTLPRITDATAWEQVAASGATALDSLRGIALTPGQAAALAEHEELLGASLTQANRLSFVVRNSIPILVIGAIVGLVLLGVAASRVAGHLSRQLSRPLNELVGWTDMIAHDQPLPPRTTVRGAPEFEVLRRRMREMSSEIAAGRERAIEVERNAAFRESARRFAHELKNPLTPIQFAVARLQRAAPTELTEVVDVLRAETERLDRLARDFAQFGRLPDGPVSDVDIVELVRYTSQSTVPAGIELTLDVPADGVTIRGRHDALQRAVANVLLNAVDACGADGRIAVTVATTSVQGAPAVEIRVRDSGPGIPPERIKTIWEPYVTSKPGGTGLGLAIARQAILAHDGSTQVECPPGGGTEFRFLLPATHEPAQGRFSIA